MVSTSTSALALRNAAPRQTDDDKDDYLRGAASIAAFVTRILGEPVAPQQIYAWAAKGHLPVGRFAGRLNIDEGPHPRAPAQRVR
jgi:hypothetical protein